MPPETYIGHSQLWVLFTLMVLQKHSQLWVLKKFKDFKKI